MKTLFWIIDTAPASVAVLCLGVAVVIGTDATFRRTVTSIVILSPLTPLFLLRWVGIGLIALVDWTLRPRRWNRVMVERARWLAEQCGADDTTPVSPPPSPPGSITRRLTR